MYEQNFTQNFIVNDVDVEFLIQEMWQMLECIASTYVHKNKYLIQYAYITMWDPIS